MPAISPYISQLYSELHEKGRSNASIQSTHTVLVNIFNEAVKLQIVTQNIVVAVSKPKHRAQEMNIWHQEQVQQFLKIATDTS